MSASGDRLVLPAARIRYRNDQPYSLDYEDIYHAPDGGAEARRVFVLPCGLDELAGQRAVREPPGDTVRVGELGFGSGLNFVVAAEHCLAAGARLCFVSCDAHPVDGDDFRRIARERAGRHPLYAELADQYPPRIRGWHQRVLAEGRVRLQLWLGDAVEALTDLNGRQRQPIDAWFLDGFAPDRNPELWTPELLARLAALSAAGTRVATFTSAGRVRRALEAAGFAMRRIDQRPHKRESLAGSFTGSGLESFTPPKQVMVAGGGLAGAAIAWQLARAGCRVRLLEANPGRTADACKAPGDAGPASRMPATVLHARLLADDTPAAMLRCHAYLHAAAMLPGTSGFQASGVLQLAGDDAARTRLQSVAQTYGRSGRWLRWVEPDEAAELARWPVSDGGLLLRGGGTVDIPALVAALTDHPAVEVSAAPLIDPPPDEPVVLACGPATAGFAPARYLELAPVHGQLDFVRVAAPPRMPLVGRGYLAPAPGGLLAAGSTYEHRPWAPETATRTNLAQLAGRDHRWCYRRRGTRSVSSDRTVIAGPLFDAEARPLSNLYVSTGHGSAGNVTAHLAAAVIAAHLLGDCPPLARDVEAALSPARFRHRQARRGLRHNATP